MMLSCLIAAALIAAPGRTQDTPVQMMTYQLVLLKQGPAQPPSAPAALKQMQEGHLARLADLNKKRINVIYGPILIEDTLRGVAILDVPSAEAARAHFADDPFVKAGVMTVEVHPWMGPKGWFGEPASHDVTNPANLEPLIFGVLERGLNTTHDKATAEEIQKGHLAYMDSLYKQGKLVMAGPLGDDGLMRGLVVYRVKDVPEAKALAENDPAVKAGRLVLHAYPWLTFKGILK